MPESSCEQVAKPVKDVSFELIDRNTVRKYPTIMLFVAALVLNGGSGAPKKPCSPLPNLCILSLKSNTLEG